MTKRHKCRRASLAVTFLYLSIFTAKLQAQSTSTTNAKPDSPTPSLDGWHMDITPYLWFAGVHGTSGVAGHNVSIHASAADVLSNFNIGFMGAFEPRYNRVLFPVDFMWIKLTDYHGLPFDGGFTTAKAEFKQTILTPGIGYRAVQHEKVTVDGLFGIRYWHMNGSVSLQPSPLGNTFSGTADWVDALGGANIQLELTPKLSIGIRGDAGAGSANHDYEIVGLFGVRVAKKWVLNAGYRYMDVDYRPSSTFVYDVAQSGLVLGATWNVK